MSDLTKLDFKAVEEWALGHGFEKKGEKLLSAPYGHGNVQIEFLIRDIRVSMVWGERVERLLTVAPTKLSIDETDMLHGAGLFSRFYAAYREDHRERPDQALMPVWFGEKVQTMIAEHIARENKPSA